MNNLKTRRLTTEELKKLTLEENGIKIVSPPLFTKEQCQYIWDETVEFMKYNTQYVTSTKTGQIYTKNNASNYRNFIEICGRPVISYVIMNDVARLISSILGVPISDLLCSIEGFYYQTTDLNRKQKQFEFIVNEFMDPLTDKYMTRCCLQVTPNEKDHSCLTSFVRKDKQTSNICSIITRQFDTRYSNKKNRTLDMNDIKTIKKIHGRPVIFDDDNIPEGTVFLIDSNNIPCHKIVAESNHLVYYFAFWRKDAPIPSVIDKTTNLRKAYSLNRMTHPETNIITFKNYSKPHCKKIQYFEHPELDTDQMAQLFGFENLTHMKIKKQELEQTENHIVHAKKMFTHVRRHEKTLAIVREKLYGLSNNLKRNIDLVETPVTPHEPETKKQCLSVYNEYDIQSDSSEPYALFDTKFDSDTSEDDLFIHNSISSNVMTQYHESFYGEKYHKTTLILYCRDLYTGLFLFGKIICSNIFTEYIYDIITKTPIIYNQDTSMFVPLYHPLMFIKQQVIIKHETNNPNNFIEIKNIDNRYDIRDGLNMVFQDIYDMTQKTTMNYDIKDMIEFYTNNPITITGNFKNWVNKSYDQVIIHPIGNYSEFNIHRACRSFDDQNQVMKMIIDTRKQLDYIETIIENIRFELFDIIDKDCYKIHFMISKRVFKISDSHILDKYKDVIEYDLFDYVTK